MSDLISVPFALSAFLYTQVIAAPMDSSCKDERAKPVTHEPIGFSASGSIIDFDRAASAATSVDIGQSVMEREFNERAERWERETGLHSSRAKRALHPDYQAIMGSMGERALPFILKRIRTSHRDWYWALNYIKPGCVSVPEPSSMEDYRRAWLAWGERNGFV